MLLDIIFQNFMVGFNLIHEVLEDLMGSAALLLGIHHIEKILVFFVVCEKLAPFGFISQFASEQFFFQQIPIIDTVVSLF